MPVVARSRSVIGPPPTSKDGMSIFSVICTIMWMPKSAGEYLPRPELISTMVMIHPVIQQIVRITGQESPRRRSLSTPKP